MLSKLNYFFLGGGMKNTFEGSNGTKREMAMP